jgi:hypothetical protein
MHRTCDVLYFHMWPVWVLHFFYIHITSWMAGFTAQKIIAHKNVSVFSLQRLAEKFLILKIIQLNIFINVRRS